MCLPECVNSGALLLPRKDAFPISFHAYDKPLVVGSHVESAHVAVAVVGILAHGIRMVDEQANSEPVRRNRLQMAHVGETFGSLDRSCFTSFPSEGLSPQRRLSDGNPFPLGTV